MKLTAPRLACAALAVSALCLALGVLSRRQVIQLSCLSRSGNALLHAALTPVHLESGSQLADEGGHHAGSGVLLFAYAQNATALERYVREAALSARGLKASNPHLRVALATNAHSQARGMRDAFDVVVPIRQDHVFSGGYKTPADGNGAFRLKTRQWLTRIYYLAHTPFALTLAVDGTVVTCTDKLAAILDREERAAPWYDLAYNTQQRNAKPHNWAIMYRSNPATRALLRDWFVHQVNRDAMGEDQTTLHDVVGRALAAGTIRRARLHSNFAAAFAPVTANGIRPRATQLLTSRAHLFHMYVRDAGEAEVVCAKLNAHSSRRRVIVQPTARKHAKFMQQEWVPVFNESHFRSVLNVEPPPAPNQHVWECPQGSQLPFVYPWDAHGRCTWAAPQVTEAGYATKWLLSSSTNSGLS
mmetsp:Transcript_17125/g.44287  ORF Transcript_17125/g.44287 Transcript_17125/m.44287 type:complete len:415 (-) Transcript_17125:152-1396(-)|eukprot:CAMPEP_0119407346 /NCGR_PEP_ID=MMETSP1335-20130426/1268_1 /TAXON_ID=259385 /ORGANISM="Chrysoculter rhomboideus, Strain RCC1486" /LENGTH=414 /DNA_ID=CAMNT_0007431445 /DNA_START=115 /DNA_END=1362 /DNA_ORIENTATION=+